METWEVEQCDNGNQRVTCPRCYHWMIVGPEWPGGGGYIARPCPYCFKASRIPGGPALVYDSNETFKITLEQANALEYIGLIQYSPLDGPNGIMYRPCAGVTIDKIRNSLA